MAQVVEILQHGRQEPVYTCQHHNDLVTHVAVLGKNVLNMLSDHGDDNCL